MYSERGGGYEIDLHKDSKISRKRPQDGHAKRRVMSKTRPLYDDEVLLANSRDLHVLQNPDKI